MVVWSEALAHSSMLVIDGKSNTHYWHSVPQEKTWTGVRYSPIFRVIR